MLIYFPRILNSFLCILFKSQLTESTHVYCLVLELIMHEVKNVA